MFLFHPIHFLKFLVKYQPRRSCKKGSYIKKRVSGGNLDTSAGINVKTEPVGGGGGGTSKGVAFEFFLHFFGQFPDPWDWKIVQI